MWAGNKHKAAQDMNSIGCLQNAFMYRSLTEQEQSCQYRGGGGADNCVKGLSGGTGIRRPRDHQETRVIYSIACYQL